MEILAEGQGAYLPPDPDGFRAWVRDNKPRTLVHKVMNEHEVIEKFVSDGDYVAYDCNYFQRGPSSLIREIIRQQKKDLWICGKFTYVALALLVEGGCATRADIGFVGFGPWLSKGGRRRSPPNLRVLKCGDDLSAAGRRAGLAVYWRAVVWRDRRIFSIRGQAGQRPVFGQAGCPAARAEPGCFDHPCASG